jgi:hypothetical protein
MSTNEMRKRMAAMIQEVYVIADRVNDRIERDHKSLTPEEEAEVVVIENGLQALRNLLDRQGFSASAGKG